MDTLIYRKATVSDAIAIRELSLAGYSRFATWRLYPDSNTGCTGWICGHSYPF